MAASSSLYPMVPLFDFILGCAPKLLLLFRFSPAPAFSPLRQSFNLNSYFQFPSTQFNFPLIYRKIRDASSPEASSDKKLKIKMSSGVSSAPRRYEAAGWLRKIIGVVAAKDLLKFQLLFVYTVNFVESPVDSALIPDKAPLSAFQYLKT